MICRAIIAAALILSVLAPPSFAFYQSPTTHGWWDEPSGEDGGDADDGGDSVDDAEDGDGGEV